MFRAASFAVRIALVSLAWLGTIEVAGAAAATDAKDVGSINFTLGYKNLSGDSNLGFRFDGLGHQVDAWTTGDTLPRDRVYQPALGIEGTWGRKNWPVQIAFDVWNSADDSKSQGHPKDFTTPAYNLRLRAQTLELGLGVRRAFDLKLVTPYIGAGGLWSREQIEIEVSDPNAGQFGTATGHAHMRTSAFGYWVGGGVYRRLGPRFQMGLAYRFSKATLPAAPFTVDSGVLPPEIVSFPGYDVLTPDSNGRPVQLLLPNAEGGGRTLHLVVGWSFPSH